MYQSSRDRRRGGEQEQVDTRYTKVFVGGLAWETQRDAMRRHFEQYGEIIEAVVITDKATGRSKGYGFVSVSLSLSLSLYILLRPFYRDG